MTGLACRVETIVSPVNWVYSIRNWLGDEGASRWLVNQFSLNLPPAAAGTIHWSRQPAEHRQKRRIRVSWWQTFTCALCDKCGNSSMSRPRRRSQISAKPVEKCGERRIINGRIRRGSMPGYGVRQRDHLPPFGSRAVRLDKDSLTGVREPGICSMQFLPVKSSDADRCATKSYASADGLANALH